MSDLLRSQVEVDDLVDRYETLGGEIKQRLEGVAGAGDAEQVERVWKELRVHGEFVTRTLNAMDRRPRPEIGDTVDVVRFEYDDRGDYCDDLYEQGTIAGVDGDKLVIRVAEQVIPAQVIPAHVLKATWSESRQEFVDDESYEFWSHYE